MNNVDKLNKSLDDARISEVVELLGNKKKIFFRNLLAGVSKGVGFSIGFYLITAIIMYILQYIVRLNIPVIGRYISDIVDIVEINRR